ncbi:hypothetical protein [Trichoplusia ni ascovirus 2c]|uniref:hypothetical protein n=1 Tax=Trichoplusia ni ascovirus 2c TaxID=328615 RepID=UPI0000E44209|nr:hypothetical protein TNAV2c_gp049 [Trichoplusia ni ascovirus 2c]ABF70566.1 hypothetical protein [Trichoplusia ni ascovirus 2c]
MIDIRNNLDGIQSYLCDELNALVIPSLCSAVFVNSWLDYEIYRNTNLLDLHLKIEENSNVPPPIGCYVNISVNEDIEILLNYLYEKSYYLHKDWLSNFELNIDNEEDEANFYYLSDSESVDSGIVSGNESSDEEEDDDYECEWN